MPMQAVTAIQATCPQDAVERRLEQQPDARGVEHEDEGHHEAGSVYFHDCSVVRYGSPPVIAAAAKGDSAVGGDTSDSTA